MWGLYLDVYDVIIRSHYQLNSTSYEAENWGKAFTSDNLLVVAGGIVLFSVWGIVKLVWLTALSLWTIMINMLGNIIGLPILVIGVLLTIIILQMLFKAWRIMKLGY